MSSSDIILDIPAVNATDKPFSLSVMVMRTFVQLATYDFETGQSTRIELIPEEWDKVLEYSQKRKETFQKELEDIKASD